LELNTQPDESFDYQHERPALAGIPVNLSMTVRDEEESSGDYENEEEEGE
jgi:hypothetical protein